MTIFICENCGAEKKISKKRAKFTAWIKCNNCGGVARESNYTGIGISGKIDRSCKKEIHPDEPFQDRSRKEYRILEERGMFKGKHLAHAMRGVAKNESQRKAWWDRNVVNNPAYRENK